MIKTSLSDWENHIRTVSGISAEILANFKK